MQWKLLFPLAFMLTKVLLIFTAYLFAIIPYLERDLYFQC